MQSLTWIEDKKLSDYSHCDYPFVTMSGESQTTKDPEYIGVYRIDNEPVIESDQTSPKLIIRKN